VEAEDESEKPEYDALDYTWLGNLRGAFRNLLGSFPNTLEEQQYDARGGWRDTPTPPRAPVPPAASPPPLPNGDHGLVSV
jgi:hypothetical protein